MKQIFKSDLPLVYKITQNSFEEGKPFFYSPDQIELLPIKLPPEEERDKIFSGCVLNCEDTCYFKDYNCSDIECFKENKNNVVTDEYIFIPYKRDKT